jgi:hypothetical protein
MAYIWNSASTGGFDKVDMDDLYVWPSTIGNQGGGALAASINSYIVAQRAAALSGGGSLTATAVDAFTPFTEENLPRSGQLLPTGSRFKGVWVTLIGTGGGGSGGETAAGAKSYAGGSGGGGGALVPRVFIPRASLGSTYTVAVPSSGGAGSVATSQPGTSGADTTFVSGSTNIVAGGGKAGTTYLAAGLGGTVTGTTGVAGTNGGAGVSSGAGGPGINGPATNSGGAGGGGGGGANVLSTRYASGKGGDANGQPGGAVKAAASSLPGDPGSLPVLGLAGSGASGGASDNAAGGAGRGYGSGGGGASLWCPNGGQGGPGYSMVEFTDILPVYLDSVGPAATGTGTSKSWVHTINGSCIVVSMSYYGSVTAPVVTATVGGVSMTQLAVVPYVTSGSNYGRLVTFILMNPPQGAQTIVVNAPGQLYGGNNSVSYQNVSSYGTVVTNSGTAALAAITVPSAPNQMVAHARSAWVTHRARHQCRSASTQVASGPIPAFR